MKFPVCKVCLKNDILCQNCNSKISEIGISPDELKAFRSLGKASEKYSILKDVEVNRVLDTPRMMLIFTDTENASKIIGKKGGMIKKLSDDLGKPIRIVTSKNVESFVREVFYSNHILGVNVVYGGEKLYKIRFPSSEKGEMPLDIEKFSKFFNSIFNEKVRVVFE